VKGKVIIEFINYFVFFLPVIGFVLRSLILPDGLMACCCYIFLYEIEYIYHEKSSTMKRKCMSLKIMPT